MSDRIIRQKIVQKKSKSHLELKARMWVTNSRLRAIRRAMKFLMREPSTKSPSLLILIDKIGLRYIKTLWYPKRDLFFNIWYRQFPFYSGVFSPLGLGSSFLGWKFFESENSVLRSKKNSDSKTFCVSLSNAIPMLKHFQQPQVDTALSASSHSSSADL